MCGRRQEQSKWEKGIDLNVDGCLDTLKHVGGERKLSPWEEEEGQAGRKVKLEALLVPGCLRACDASLRAPQSCSVGCCATWNLLCTSPPKPLLVYCLSLKAAVTPCAEPYEKEHTFG